MTDRVIFSVEGLTARVSAHRFAVQRAMGNGIEIKPEVMDDYPELQTNTFKT